MSANHLTLVAFLLLTLANIPTQATSSQFTKMPMSALNKAMLGIDPIMSNPLGKRDTGLKDPIFLPVLALEAHQETIALNNFIGQAVQDVRCNRVSSSSMTTVSNFNSYRNMMSSSVSFNAGGGISAQYMGFGGGVHVGVGSGSDTYDQKHAEFFRKTEGEILLGGAECQTHLVTVNLNAKPVFTQNFLIGLRKLNLASQNPQSENSVHVFQDFVENFGTHYQDTTILGSKLVIEKLFFRKAASVAESTARKRCVASSFSTSLKVGTPFVQAEANFSRDAKKCSGSQSSSNAFNSLGLSSERIITVGSPPYSDPDTWAGHALETPVPIHYRLEKISRMFTHDWFDDIIPDEKFNGTAMRDFFENLSEKYCEIVMGRPCTATLTGCGYSSICSFKEQCIDDDNAAGGFTCRRKGCGYNSNCSFTEQCINDDNAAGGFTCKRKGCGFNSNCRSYEKCVNDNTAAEGFTCRKGCGFTSDCPYNKACVNDDSQKGFRCVALCSSSHRACPSGESCHAELHSARGFICVPTQRGRAVLAGGTKRAFGRHRKLTEVESLNYRSFPDLPQPTDEIAMAKAGDYLYACGGERKNSKGKYIVADCYHINVNTPGNAWQKMQSAPVRIWGGSAVSVGDTMIWFFDGSLLVKLDARRRVFTTVSLPFWVRRYHCSVSNGTHVYVIGVGSGENEIWTNKNQKDETEWQLAGYLMRSRTEHACLWYGSNIMITGGEERRRDVELFNTETRMVWVGKEMPRGLKAHKMMMHSGMPTVVGGYDGGFHASITSFFIAENRWIESSMKLKTQKAWVALVEV